MTGDAVATNPASSIRNTWIRNTWPWQIAVVALLAALADWLFFRRVVGVSLTLFVLAVAAGVVLTNRVAAGRREFQLYAGLLAAAVLPALEHINIVSVLIAGLGLACFALGVTASLRGNLIEKCLAVGWFLVSGPFQFARDLPVVRAWARERGVPVNLTLVKGWVVPLALGAIFLGLFSAANPLIANWLSHWSLTGTIRQLDMQRLLFWIGVVIAVWMFVRVRERFAPIEIDAPAFDAQSFAASGPLFNDAAIMRSLVLFNLLFAVQTVMDIHYLWAGAALPDGMSYAAYAHRGAYPLIATALLAAAFVIAAMRPGSAAERSPLMRALVFVWVGQNVLLVISAILRLDLYVETYLLTYWRVAAFVWMLIVAAGLILIVVRLVTYRSNAWLVAANATMLAATIYICSFVNFADVVASYNVARSNESANAGRPVDLTYIAALGPQAIPALDRYLAANGGQPAYFRLRRDALAAAYLRESADWRAWTFRRWRLSSYLQQEKTQP